MHTNEHVHVYVMYRDLVVHHDTYYLSVMNLTSLRPIRSVRMRLTNVVQNKSRVHSKLQIPCDES